MNWILIAITSGMLMTGHYDTEEQCEGRKAMLAKDKIISVKCVNMQSVSFGTGTSICSTITGQCR